MKNLIALILSIALFTTLAACNNNKQSPPEQPTLTLLSYNVWYGFQQAPNRKPAYLQWVKSQAPDIVSLQELNGYTPEKLAADAKHWNHPHTALLKTKGFPTGLTSSKPITDVKRFFDGFHHGLLRARTHGYIVYVIHLHPSNYQTRRRELKLILDDIQSLTPADKHRVILAGDFNTFSPFDRADYDQHKQLEPFFAERDKKYKEKNLHNNQLDYAVIQGLLRFGLIDLEAEHRINNNLPFTGTFPTKIEKKGDHGHPRKLDYIFTFPTLAKRIISANIIADQHTHHMSDHYPIIATFK